MYCHQCGKEINDEVKFCPYCGAPIDLGQTQTQTDQGYQPLQDNPYNQPYNQNYNNSNVKADDAPSAGFAVLSFFIPIVGLILYIVWKNEYPAKAKSCLKGLIVGVVLYVISLCCMFAAIGSIATDSEEDLEFNGYYNAVVETIPYESID
ncbi:MAG: zinc ribbon domain-containing protein [Thomasclavelia ramosa]|uniref:zinc ribbon domain-containing protein n=1 Tax=Longibaculum muris TaxID=1796628 RepID=UPI0012B7106C|nr:zinc ribbon domain-containing protein [Longibaculum muris]